MNAILERPRTTLDIPIILPPRREECWEGEIFMPPMANTIHQHLRDDLLVFMKIHWEQKGRGPVFSEVNLTLPSWEDRWTKNYRIPDMIVMTPDRMRHNKGRYIAGPPLIVVEVLSFGDRSVEKLDFYRELGVPEVWFLHHGTRRPELFILDERYKDLVTDADGWLRSPATGLDLRHHEGILHARMAGDDATMTELD